jgi:DNA replication protein DnaC
VEKILSNFWENDYKDLTHRFLSDNVIEFLEHRNPNLSKFDKRGCPTCNGPGSDNCCGECKQQLQLYKHYLNAGIGQTYQRLDWSDYHGDPAALGVAETYLRQHKAMVQNGMGILYYGSWGTGKTLLAVLIAKELVKLGYSVYFATFTQMIDEFTRGWGNNTDRERFEDKVIKADVFILDDVGKEFRNKSNLSEATFDHVLRQRALDNRSTFMTTNLNTDELNEGYGSAIFSLLKERMIVQEVTGIDYRETSRTRVISEIREQKIRRIY